MPAGDGDVHAEELTEIIRSIQERVRARYPATATGIANVAVADLTPVARARDAAEGKVAAIGTVNPRPPGLVNSIVQSVKKLVSRALDWHVREQVEFNRAAVNCTEALLNAMAENNRALVALARDFSARFAQLERLSDEARELRDIRSHWAEWRVEWERKVAASEMQFLRSVADLQAGFSHRATVMESGFRDQMRALHTDFLGALERSAAEIQKQLWKDLDRVRNEYERLIHVELRAVRQKAFPLPVHPGASQPATPPELDWLRFADRFRGPEESVREKQRFYVPWFGERKRVLDAGCGRGEFLELMRECGVPARGIDSSEHSVALCVSKGLEVERADLFEHLASLHDGALDGIFCAQVVEHLPPEKISELVRLAYQKLEPGGVIAIETPNPECLAIFATHFYLDPTHTRPVPPPLLWFYLEEAGFGRMEVRKLSPAQESIPGVAALPAEFREAFFSGLDYAVLGIRL